MIIDFILWVIGYRRETSRSVSKKQRKNWNAEVNEFLQRIYEKGIENGCDQEHVIKKRVCKYFRHEEGMEGVDGCVKTQKDCSREYCPAENEIT